MVEGEHPARLDVPERGTVQFLSRTAEDALAMSIRPTSGSQDHSSIFRFDTVDVEFQPDADLFGRGFRKARFIENKRVNIDEFHLLPCSEVGGPPKGSDGEPPDLTSRFKASETRKGLSTGKIRVFLGCGSTDFR